MQKEEMDECMRGNGPLTYDYNARTMKAVKDEEDTQRAAKEKAAKDKAAKAKRE